jgi:hypothetical protein
MECRNLTLRAAIAAYTTRSLEVAAENHEESDNFRLEVEEWRSIEGNAFRRERREETEYSLLIHRIKDRLHGLPEYSAAKDTLFADEVIRPQLDVLVGTMLGAHPVDSDAVLDGFVLALLSARKTFDRQTFEFDSRFFEERYAEVEEAFYADEIAFVVLMPLIGLTLEGVPLEPEPGLQLDRMTDEEIGTCLDLDLLRSPFPAFRDVAFVGEGSRHGVRLAFTLPKRIGHQFDGGAAEAPRFYEEQEATLDLLVQSLRLLKSGMVTPAGRITSSKSWFLRGTRSYGYGSHGPTVWANEYTLSATEGEALVQLWKELHSTRVQRHRALTLAIRRLSLADDRVNPEDKLLDLMISAEALLLSDAGREQDRGELSYRLSLRAGFLLGTNTSERRTIYKHMRRAYEARSRIAHGGEVAEVKVGDGSKVDLLSFTKMTHGYIRDAIHTLIRQVPEKGPMVDWEGLVMGRDDPPTP